MSLLNQGLLLLWVFTVLVGIHISTQKLTYDVTVSVSSSRLLAPVLNISQSVHLKQPLRVSLADVVQDLMGLDIVLVDLSFCLYFGMRSSIAWWDLASGALGNER